MKKRFIVPQFKGQEKIPNLSVRIREIIRRYGAVRILHNPKHGCWTYALDPDAEAEQQANILHALQTEISREARTLAYKAGGPV